MVTFSHLRWDLGRRLGQLKPERVYLTFELPFQIVFFCLESLLKQPRLQLTSCYSRRNLYCKYGGRTSANVKETKGGVPLGWSRSGSVIQIRISDPDQDQWSRSGSVIQIRISDPDQDQWSKITQIMAHQRNRENPCPEWIPRFLWCAMIWMVFGSLILIWIIPKERTLNLSETRKCPQLTLILCTNRLVIHNFTQYNSVEHRTYIECL